MLLVLLVLLVAEGCMQVCVCLRVLIAFCSRLTTEVTSTVAQQRERGAGRRRRVVLVGPAMGRWNMLPMPAPCMESSRSASCSREICSRTFIWLNSTTDSC